ISVDDVIDVVEEEATEDIQRLGGSTPLEQPYLKTKFYKLFRARVGWLLLLFAAESISGTILRYFQDIIEYVLALTFFIPLLLATGGNTGSQAATMVIRAIALGEVKFKD